MVERFLSGERRWLDRVWVGAAVVALGWALIATDALSWADRQLRDVYTRLFHGPAPGDIVIVAIDDDSLGALGRWPWPRRLHAQLIERLTESGARSVGIDILFAEPDAQDPDGDRLLASAIARHGRVALAVAPTVSHAGKVAVARPLPELTAAAALGHVDVELDPDGIVRTVFLRAGLGRPGTPALGLALLELAGLPQARVMDALPLTPVPEAGSQAWARQSPIEVSYVGPPGSFTRVSAARLLAGDPDAARQVRGRHILVGVTAAGLGHVLVTPVSGNDAPMPGVELTANVLATLMDPPAVRRLPPSAHFALMAGFAIFPLLVYPRRHPRLVLLASAAVFGLVLVCNLALLLGLRLWFAPSAALAAIALSYPLWSWRCLDTALTDLTDERNRAAATLGCIGEAVLTADRAGSIEYMNPVAEALTGHRLRDARGRPLQEVVRLFEDGGERPLPPPWLESLADGTSAQASRPALLRGVAGQEHSVRWSASPIRGGSGTIEGMVLALSDVSEILSLSKAMARQATHDALTDLPNRILLEDRLTSAIARSRRSKQKLAILFVDLDGFKKVNDAYGHAAGDALLKEVAERLRTHCRQEDSVARWGGDEFVMLLENLETRDAATSAAAKVLSVLAQPVRVLDHEVYVTASIGISVFPRDGDEVGTLFKRADAAMYRAKAKGGNLFQFYSHEMSDRAVRRLDLEKSLWAALQREELRLHFQPQVDLARGQVTGAEALLRWERTAGSLLSPAQFLSVAEQSDLIHAIGDWVLQSSFAQLARLRQLGLASVHVAINLAPRQLLRRELYARVAALLRQHDLDPACVTLEISENLFLHDAHGIAQKLHGLRKLGVRVAIDDFGTGYSSIGYLKRLPVDQVKIDKSFVRHVTSKPDDLEIVRGIVNLAHSLRLGVMAEGVETLEQRECLQALGCDAAQGFQISHPLAPAALEAYLLERIPSHTTIASGDPR
jgi:diguanylate cyclase (GGDEF)-like protein